MSVCLSVCPSAGLSNLSNYVYLFVRVHVQATELLPIDTQLTTYSLCPRMYTNVCTNKAVQCGNVSSRNMRVTTRACVTYITMCVFVYPCIYIDIICINIYIYIYACVYIYIYTYIHMYLYAYDHACVNAYTNANRNAYVYMYMSVCVCVYLDDFVYGYERVRP